MYIQIEIDKEKNKKVSIYKAEKELSSKKQTIEYILKNYDYKK